MDVAFHFLAELHGNSYGLPIEEMFFDALLGASDQGGRIELRVGNFLLHQLARRQQKTLSGAAFYHDEERQAFALQEWLASNMPSVVAVDELTVPIDRAEGSWVFLRVTDPSAPEEAHHAGTPVAGLGGAVAYSSPWFLEPASP